MDATRGARIFTGLAIALFVGTLVRVFYLHDYVESRPCSKMTDADIAIVATPTAPSLVNFFPNKIWLGSPLCVAVAGPAHVAVDKDGKPTLHLFLDGLELKGSTGALVDRKKNLVQFDVVRTADDADVWNKIINQLELEKWGAGVSVDVGVGTDKDGEFNSAAQTPLAPLELMVIDIGAFILGVFAFVAAVIALYFAAKFSAILRDGDATSTYSLARVQMAFWLYLVTAAFVFIWLVTGDYNGVLTPQALTLLGISGTTGLMAISVPGTPVVATKGFWKDILSDGGGVALHRLQIVVWTAILGVVFFFAIYHSFRLPAFDSNLLILLGISGVTYVGFKFNEK
jgi:hypothetical protein